jgi:membrane fusion protein, protease secretion system
MAIPMPDSVADFQANENRAVRQGWAIVVGGLGMLLAWSLWAELDTGVAMHGMVVVDGYRRPVQSASAGRVAQILVKEGSTVQAGQPVARMDRTQAEADFLSAQVQWNSVAAQHARLTAELSNSKILVFPSRPNWAARAWPDDGLRANFAAQESHLAVRRNSLASELKGLDETIQGIELQNAELLKSRLTKSEQLQLIEGQLVELRKLASDGLHPRNRVIDLERTSAGLRGAMAEDTGTISRNIQAAAELRARIESRRLGTLKEVQAQLSDISRDMHALGSKLTALQHEVGNTDLHAPVDGVVVGLAIHTPGAFVNAGALLFEIVPIAGALKVDALLPPQWIDKVRKGQPTDVQFTAFDLATTPKIRGVVDTVSADAIADPKQQVSNYRISVTVPAESLKILQGFVLKPGMPAEVFVRTGERNALSYLIKPLQDRVGKAMTEP